MSLQSQPEAVLCVLNGTKKRMVDGVFSSLGSQLGHILIPDEDNMSSVSPTQTTDELSTAH